MNKGLEIPFEIADGITLSSLKDQHRYLKEETRLHLEEGEWLHAEDLAKNVRLIAALELLIPYYGGEL
jgi:hypothetical protein